jgi:DUF2917 family protein
MRKTKRDADGAVATFILQRDQVSSIRMHRHPYRVACIAGTLWSTREGSPKDSVLTAGQSMICRDRGRTVIQALGTTTVRIECPRAARVTMGSPMRQVLQLG